MYCCWSDQTQHCMFCVCPSALTILAQVKIVANHALEAMPNHCLIAAIAIDIRMNCFLLIVLCRLFFVWIWLLSWWWLPQFLHCMALEVSFVLKHQARKTHRLICFCWFCKLMFRYMLDFLKFYLWRKLWERQFQMLLCNWTCTPFPHQCWIWFCSPHRL